MIRDKTYLECTEEELKRHAKLTPKEKAAIDIFLAAAKALPRGITVSMEDYGDRTDGIRVSKRITRGSSQEVAHLYKPSLIF